MIGGLSSAVSFWQYFSRGTVHSEVFAMVTLDMIVVEAHCLACKPIRPQSTLDELQFGTGRLILVVI